MNYLPFLRQPPGSLAFISVLSRPGNWAQRGSQIFLGHKVVEPKARSDLPGSKVYTLLHHTLTIQPVLKTCLAFSLHFSRLSRPLGVSFWERDQCVLFTPTKCKLFEGKAASQMGFVSPWTANRVPAAGGGSVSATT